MIAFFLRVIRRAMPIASQQAVEPSYIEALATSQPSSRATWRLELEQDLQRALRDFRLVGRVGGQELAALDEVIDARRDVMLVGAAAEEEGHLARDHILRAKRGQVALDRHLAGMHRQALDRAP